MSEMEPITGVIASVQGTTPGPASGITYTMNVNLDGTVISVDGQRPSLQRWPDAIGGETFHVRALPPGSIVPGTLDRLQQRVYWWFRELPDAGPCDDQPGDGGNFLPIRLLPDVRPEPPPPPPPSGGSSGSVSAPDSGGLGEGGIA